MKHIWKLHTYSWKTFSVRRLSLIEIFLCMQLIINDFIMSFCFRFHCKFQEIFEKIQSRCFIFICNLCFSETEIIEARSWKTAKNANKHKHQSELNLSNKKSPERISGVKYLRSASNGFDVDHFDVILNSIKVSWKRQRFQDYEIVVSFTSAQRWEHWNRGNS